MKDIELQVGQVWKNGTFLIFVKSISDGFFSYDWGVVGELEIRSRHSSATILAVKHTKAILHREQFYPNVGDEVQLESTGKLATIYKVRSPIEFILQFHDRDYCPPGHPKTAKYFVMHNMFLRPISEVVEKASIDDLKPGDILKTVIGDVVLLVRQHDDFMFMYIDDGKTEIQTYDSLTSLRDAGVFSKRKQSEEGKNIVAAWRSKY